MMSGAFIFMSTTCLFISRHLRRLELYDTKLNDSFLDLSGCPGLEDLYIYNGDFVHAKRISSKSVKHLSVIDSCFNEQIRTIIDVPSTISLWLENPWDRTPVLRSMPLLAVAFVRFGTDCMCWMSAIILNLGIVMMSTVKGVMAWKVIILTVALPMSPKNKKSVLLNGLSGAKTLVLTDESQKFIFKRDVKWCPVFRMLKTLVLNEYWCVPPYFCELACLLEHSPVLEKLTLQILSKGPEHKFEIIGSYSQMEGSAAISENLKIVEVKFEVADEGVLKVLIFLQTLNIDFKFDEEEETLVEDVSTTS